MGLFKKKKGKKEVPVVATPQGPAAANIQQPAATQGNQMVQTAQVTAVARPPPPREPTPVPPPAPVEYVPPPEPAPPPQQERRITTTPKEPIPEANSQLNSSIQNLSVGDERLATTEITRNLVKRFIADIWNRGELDDIPKICHPSLRFNGHIGMDRVGHEGFSRMVSTVREALGDYHCEIHSLVAENNKAFCRLRFTGKHVGNLLGYPATGKTVCWNGASEFSVKVW